MSTAQRELNRLQDYDYVLPEELIAQYPLPERSQSRLLQLGRQSGEIKHGQFWDLLDWLAPGDLLVRNNTRVIPARLYGEKTTGGKLECLVERVLTTHTALVHMRSNKTPKTGALLHFGSCTAELLGREEELFLLRFDAPVLEVLHANGHMPLPPYMTREDEALDESRYQTVYAKHEGAVAAPTAGLHFDEALLAAIAKKGVEVTEVTLHVGAGTFQPVRVDNLDEHVMHREYLQVGLETCEAVAKTRARGGRVVAIGTTSVRCLESACQDGVLLPYQGDTDLFIRPGYRYQCVDALVTNFHLPQSTLLMLVSAFAGYDSIKNAYLEAVAQRYRFFSYGDAMLIG